MPETLAPTPTKLNVEEIIDTLKDTPEFKSNQQMGYPFQRLIARSALELAGMDHHAEWPNEEADAFMEDTFEINPNTVDAESALNAIIGLMPGFIHGIEGLRHSKTIEPLSRDAYKSMKRRTAQFNHAVKALIEQDPTLDAATVVNTVTTLYGVMNRRCRWGDDREGYEKEALWFKNQFECTVRGMQQEVVARQVIEEINRLFPVKNSKKGKKTKKRVAVDSNVSAEADMHGADMYVTLDGVTFPIDIKASERTAERVRNKVSSHPMSIITSGIEHYEFNGGFSVSPERAAQAAPGMLQKLLAARKEFLEKRAHRPTPVDGQALAA